MWFDETTEVFEMFRSNFPFSFLFFVPILIIMSPVSPVAAAHEFNVYRMQHFDLQSVNYGCRSAPVNLEAKSLDARIVTRRCVVARLKEVTMGRFRDILLQNAGAFLILLPSNLSDMSVEETKLLTDLELDLMQEEIPLPVYFAQETDELMEIYNDIYHASTSDQAATAVEALMSSALANGFQLVVNGGQAKALSDFQLTNIQGKLSGLGIEDQLPTVVIVAHYDSYGIAPALAEGGDSNASGVIALLELARLFSKLYTNSRTHAKYNLVFMLSGGGKFNYQGSKRWIEDNMDSPDTNLLADVAFVLCLDSLGNDDVINLHVSKPPREDSDSGIFIKSMEEVIKLFYPEMSFKLVHKKINLAEDMLAWEHERYSMKRMPAFTLSHHENPKLLNRGTVLDTRYKVDKSKLSRNIHVIAEALARYSYNMSNIPHFQLFDEGMNVQHTVIESWLTQLTSQPRAAQLLPKDHSLLVMLSDTLNRYLKDVRVSVFKADKRDPEFVFYTGAEFTMSAYNVKPAIFDLLLALGIIAYLGVMYLASQHFYLVSGLLQKILGADKIKKH